MAICKLIRVVAFFFVALVWSDCFGQIERQVDLKKKIHITSGSIQFSKLLEEISAQAGIAFSFNSKRITKDNYIKFSHSDLSLYEILSELSKQMGLKTQIIENHIILIDNPHILIPTTKYPLNASNTRSSSSIQRKPTIQAAKPSKDEFIEADLKKDSLINDVSDTVSFSLAQDSSQLEMVQQEQPLNNSDLIPKALELKSSEADSTNNTNPSATANSQNSTSKPFAHIGISYTESFYGLGIQLGYPRIFGTISWNTNVHVNHWRFGLGSSIPIGNRYKLILGINTGFSSLNTHVLDSTMAIQTDSLPGFSLITAKFNLTSIETLVEISLFKNLKLQIGPHFSILNTSYSHDGSPYSVDKGTEKNLRMADIPFPTHVTYSSSSQEERWLGIKINLLYRINFFNKK